MSKLFRRLRHWLGCREPGHRIGDVYFPGAQSEVMIEQYDGETGITVSYRLPPGTKGHFSLYHSAAPPGRYFS